jgi:large subunit ribosomal protein L21
MRFAIVECGGKQYRAVEGTPIEVDRLPKTAGEKYEFERVLLMADGADVVVGAPAVSEIKVHATVVDNFRGPKVVSFRYSPKKRIRVKGGHRQQYTRLMIDFIGRAGEERKVDKLAGTKSSTSARKSKPAAKRAPAKAAPKKRSPSKKAG